MTEEVNCPKWYTWYMHSHYQRYVLSWFCFFFLCFEFDIRPLCVSSFSLSPVCFSLSVFFPSLPHLPSASIRLFVMFCSVSSGVSCVSPLLVCLDSDFVFLLWLELLPFSLLVKIKPSFGCVSAFGSTYSFPHYCNSILVMRGSFGGSSNTTKILGKG